MQELDENDDRDPVEELAEEFFARKRRGEHPTLDEYAEAHPELADRIRSFFPAVQLLEEFSPPQSPPKTPEQLGEFRIIREIGRGGMGVVYEAEQTSLGRRVALKVLPPNVDRDPAFLARFHREARTAARLHHTNIVPVHGVGAQDGVHYLAMQLINGIGLDWVLSDLRHSAARRETPAGGETKPTNLVRAATRPIMPESESAEAKLVNLRRVNPPAYYGTITGLIAQAADALAYAHGQGVVHRDIKPGNLLYERSGILWVSDFGLAKATGSDELTQPGFVVGTPRYLAPERFAGNDGPPGDVYALGATLYELLTLKPVFTGDDPVRLSEQIRYSEPIRPSAHVVDLPRDLETVCLKCLEKDPARRYAADELAIDLRRFLDGRPVLARRIGPIERLGRWARRYPVVAGLTAGLFLVLAAGAITSTIFWREAVRHEADAVRDAAAAVAASQRADEQKQVAVQQRDLANERLKSALEVVDDFFVQVSESTLLDVPGLQPLRRELLQTALAYYQSFLARSGNDPTVRMEVAAAHFRLGQLREQIATKKEAEDSARAALAIYEPMLRADPKSSALRHRVANCHVSLGRLAVNTASDSDAVKHYETAIHILSSLCSEEPSNEDARRLLATAQTNLGAVHQLARRFDEGVRNRRIAISLLTELVKAHPNDARMQDRLANSLTNVGLGEADRGRLPEAERDLKEAVRIYEVITVTHPVPRFQSGLAHAYMHSGDIANRTGRRTEGIGLLNKAKEICERLAADNPQVVDHPEQLSKIWLVLAQIYVADKKLDEATAAYEAAHRLLAGIQAKDPDNRHLQARYGGTFVDLGNMLVRKNRHAEAVAPYTEARAIFDKLVAREPEFVDYQMALGAVCQNCGRSLLRLKRTEEAFEWLTKGVAAYRFALARTPAARAPLGTILLILGLTELERGNVPEAVAALRECLELGPAKPAEFYAAAQALGKVAKMPGFDATLDDACAAQAVVALRQAGERGIPVAQLLPKDEAFSNWRSRPDFQTLLK